MTKHTILVTGATGYIGSAVAARLVAGGHEVHGLTRHSESAASLKTQGIQPLIGDLSRAETYTPVLERCTALVHAASDHDLGPVEVERSALDAFENIARKGRLARMIYTSGLWVHGDTGGRIADETTPLDPLELVTWRPAHEQRVLDLAAHGVAPIVLRPSMVYGEARGVVNAMFDQADRGGPIQIHGDGAQRWCLVHRDDLAEVYALALERAPARAVYLVEEGTTISVRDLAQAIAAVTGARAESLAAASLIEKFGLYGKALLADVQVSAAKARRELRWTPRHAFASEVEALFGEWKAARAAAGR